MNRKKLLRRLRLRREDDAAYETESHTGVQRECGLGRRQRGQKTLAEPAQQFAVESNQISIRPVRIAAGCDA